MSAWSVRGGRWMGPALVCGLVFVQAVWAADQAWITVATPKCPLIRKEFTLPAAPAKAVVRIVGLGHFELRVNGKRAGDSLINQPWSQYDKTIYFQEIDVTPLLREAAPTPRRHARQLVLVQPAVAARAIPQGRGRNRTSARRSCSGVDADIETADGGAHSRRLGRQLEDRRPARSRSATSTAARTTTPGWNRAGWDSARLRRPRLGRPPSPTSRTAGQARKAVLAAASARRRSSPPSDVVPAGPGVFHVFFGQNASGILRFTVEGKAGQSFTVQPSEYRSDKGEFMKPRWGDPVLFRYTLKGGGPGDASVAVPLQRLPGGRADRGRARTASPIPTGPAGHPAHRSWSTCAPTCPRSASSRPPARSTTTRTGSSTGPCART